VTSYVERPVVSPLVACTSEQVAPMGKRVVPGAGVDLIWSGKRLSIAGPDTKARVVDRRRARGLVGPRLRPGPGGAVSGLPAS
jgi:hypothetical protein